VPQELLSALKLSGSFEVKPVFARWKMRESDYSKTSGSAALVS
jgi:hypothetical protein